PGQPGHPQREGERCRHGDRPTGGDQGHRTHGGHPARPRPAAPSRGGRRCQADCRRAYHGEVDVPEKSATLGLTYDDVLLLPGHSDLAPDEIDTTTRLTREIELK